MSNLWNLTNEVEKLYIDLSQSVDEETGEINDEEIVKALAVKETEFNDKAIAVATVQRRFESRTKEIAEEIKRLQALKKRSESVSERLKSSLQEACQRLGKTKIDGISAAISFRASQKTVIDDENIIPEEYFNIKITKTPDLTKIKNAINNGENINGAHLENCQNIQIK